jgi:hypothetical protein
MTFRKTVRTAPLLSRYTYDPALVPAYGTPLYDNKQAKPIPPTSTVRVGTQILTPKQVVYIMHHPDAHPTPTNPDPRITLPPVIRNVDSIPTNILIENLKGAETSRRWCTHGGTGSVLIPKHLLDVMTEDDFIRLGLTPYNKTQSDNKT